MGSAPPRSDTARIRDRLADDLDRWRIEHRVPGTALAVIGPGDRRMVLVSGVADEQTGDPLRADHRFQIGSISKVITALTVLRAVDAGAARLSDPIVRHVPWFQAGPWTPDVTIHHLLCHLGGLPIGPDWSDSSAFDVWALRALDAQRPGERYWYSNVGYKTLAVALGSILGGPLPEAQEADVLRPLGMHAARARVGAVDASSDATGHEPEPERYPRSLVPRVHAPGLVGSMGDGNVLASVDDVATLAAALLRLDAGLGPLLTATSAAALFRPHARVARGHAYGYGLGIDTTDGRRRVGHGGDMPGFRTSLIAEPDRDVAVVVLTNLRGAPTRDLAWHALDVATWRWPGSAPVLDLTPTPDPAVGGQYEDEHGIADLRTDHGAATLTLDGVDRQIRTIDSTTFEVLDPALGRHRLVARPPTRRHGPALALGPRSLQRRGATTRPATSRSGRVAGLVGTYRSSDPWSRSVEVILRDGRLRLVDDAGEESELVRVGRDRYRVGTAPNPERAIADAWVDGHPLRLTVSGRPLVRDA